MFKVNDTVRLKGSQYMYTVQETWGDLVLVTPDDSKASKPIKLFISDIELVRRPWVQTTQTATQVTQGKYTLEDPN